MASVSPSGASSRKLAGTSYRGLLRRLFLHRLDLRGVEWSPVNLRGKRGRKGLHTKQFELAGLEGASTEFRFFLLSMITGLLSTPEYIRASLAHVPGGHSRAIVEKLERQEVLYDRSRRFTFILTEQAARSLFLPPDAMAVQLDRLASLTRLPNVRLGVIPLNMRMPGNPLNTFTVYDDRLVTAELSTEAMVFRDPGDVRAYLEEFAAYEELALFGGEVRGKLSEWSNAYRS
ncbi:DUF5753 domain-containing protein [Streptomyces sp. NPDC002742]|uniref:DUF5753 domain-containing protein n=1 Tax=Streptomyces sp. NPDC002742 TaxID=3364663 RepID=UPI0036C2E7ED